MGALLWLTLSAVVAVLLRWGPAADAGLWVDEAYTVLTSSLPWPELTAQLRADDAPPLYYLLQKTILSAFGTSELATRALSLGASLGTLTLGWHWFRTSFPVALPYFVLTWATSTLSIFYAQQARSYAWVHFLLLLALFLWSRMQEREKAVHLPIGLGLTLLGLLYTHNLSVWMVVAFTLLALLRGRRPGRPEAVLVLVLVLGSIPWLLQVVSQLGVHRELNAWMGGWWEARPVALGPLYSFGVFSNGTAPWIRPPVPLPGMETKWQLAAMLVWVAVTVGLAGSLRQIRRRDPLGAAVRAGWTIVAAAFLGLALTYWISGPAYVLGRTDTFAFVPFIVLVAIGWSGLPRKLGWVCLVIWALAGFATVARTPENPKGADRAVAAWLSENIEAGDPIVVPALGRPSLEYYARRNGWWDDSGGIRAFPGLLDENPAAVFPTPLESLSEYEEEALRLRSAWAADGITTARIIAIPASAAEITPPPARASLEIQSGDTMTANDLRYPMSVLVYSLVGLEPVTLEARFVQDWVGGQRVLLSIPRQDWVDPDSLRKIEVSP